MKARINFWILLPLLLLAPLACDKTYTLAPLSANAPTATPTNTPTNSPTLTPCGYPGNTCTFTFTNTFTLTRTPTSTSTSTPTPTPTNSPTNSLTPTYTGTPTWTFTITNTPTITYTPSVLLPPDSVVGIMDPAGTGKYMVYWLVDPDPRITQYVVYVSSTGLPGSYSAAVTQAKATHDQGVLNGLTTFNAYLYVVARGTLPDSAPSRAVHAVSGTTATNSYTISASSSLTPTFTITGGFLPAAVMRSWDLPQVYPYHYWYWSDDGSPFMNSVTCGYSATGITWVNLTSLNPSTTYSVIVRTFNSENWNIDITTFNFTTP